MNKLSVIILSAALISVLIAIALATRARTPALPQPSPSPVAAVTTAAKKEEEPRIVIFEKPRVKLTLVEWWPTEVLNVTETEKGPHKGDWIIEIQNVSDRPIKSVQLLLGVPCECEAFVMGSGLWLGLGEDKPYFTRPAKPTFDPGETDKIVVQRNRLNEVLPARELKSCPPEKSYCYLYLDEIRYVDGTKWQMKHDPEDPSWKDR